MNQKQRTRKRSKELGVSYQQSLNMYRPHKQPQQSQIEDREEEAEEEYEAYLARETRKILSEDDIKREVTLARREAEYRELKTEELEKVDIPRLIKGDF